MGRIQALFAACVVLVHCSHASSPPDTTPAPPACDACAPPSWTTLDLVAGLPGGRGWVDGALTVAHFDDPWAIAADGAGHLYVADGQMIRAIDIAAGMVTTPAGTFGAIGGADGVGAAATFDAPSGLAWAAGTLYLTDTENNTLRALDPATRAVTTVAGAYGQPGNTDAIGPAARFVEPEGIAIDASGAMYIADTDNNMIRAMNTATREVTTIAGAPGTSGTDDGVGAAARFNKPAAVTLSNGNLYVIDGGSQSIRKVVVSTRTVSTVAKFPSVPRGLCVDGADLVVSMSDDTLVRVAADGTSTLLAGAVNSPGFSDATGQDARFDSPAGLLNDGAGKIYVVDNGNAVIRAFDVAGKGVTTFAGARSAGSDDGVGSQARFSAPRALASDGAVAYVADSGNATVRKVVLATGAVTTIAGAHGSLGDADGPGPSARFFQIVGMAFDAPAGKLYLADAQNRNVRRVDLATTAVDTLVFQYGPGEGVFDTPSGAAIDGGRLYVTDYGTHTLRAIDLATLQLTTLAGRARAAGTKDGVGSDATFYGPEGVAGDGKGHLFVADNLNQTVRQIDLASGAVTTLAGEPGVQGAVDGVGRAARFRYPSSLASDAVGNLYVADAGNAIRRVEVATGTVTTVIGTLGGAGLRLGPLPAQVSQPSALAITPSGALLIVSENTVLIAH